MRFQLPPLRYFLYALPFLTGIFWFGLRNKPDPLWLEANRLVRQPCMLINDVPDSLQRLYCDLHGLPFRAGDRQALSLISIPYKTNIEWGAFKHLVRSMEHADKKRIIVSGVTGVGATKQAKRAAYLLAGTTERVLEVDCAPQFDVEYHKRYIGYEVNGRFMPGLLLQFWKRCQQSPQERFVVVFDNLDKINPETFFGPELWESLSSPKDTAFLGGNSVQQPSNCYMVSVTHLGPGSYVEFNEEHFKRLGQPFILKPNPLELIAHLRQQAKSAASKPAEAARFAEVLDTTRLRNFVFYFLKANQLVRDRYGEGYQLGQGSNLRNFFTEAERPLFKTTFLNHLNNLKPDRPLRERDFDNLDYTIATGGLELGSNAVARQLQYLQDTGYLVEITMVLTTALFTFLASLWVFRRREQIIRRYGMRTQEVHNAFEQQDISAEEAAKQLENIKREVDALVMRRKLNYTEGLYFLAFIEDKVKRIEYARNVSENFLELFNAFMEDEVLTEGEYQKLRQFLDSIRHKIPDEIFVRFSDKVEMAYNGFLRGE